VSRDVINDFDRSEDDVIDLRAIDAQKGGGNQKFHFIGKQGFHDEAGELHIVRKAGFVLVEGDINGDGKADLQILVANTGNLGVGDFIL
jgi:hypothetical protein